MFGKDFLMKSLNGSMYSSLWYDPFARLVRIFFFFSGVYNQNANDFFSAHLGYVDERAGLVGRDL